MFLLFQFQYFFFFLSFLHFLSDPISFFVFFSFFLSFPQQTETTEIKENSSTNWGWLQGTPDHEPRLDNAPISRPLLSSATNSCLALNSFGAEIHKYLKPTSISFLKIFKSFFFLLIICSGFVLVTSEICMRCNFCKRIFF